MKKNTFTFGFAIFLFCLLIGGRLLAAGNQSTHVLMTPEELEIRNKAKKKLYVGGVDEEPLKVQSQLSVVNRKVSPPSENHEDAPAAEASED